MNELKLTTIEELQRYGAGTVVELPPFAEGQPFVARLKRPSMLVLIKSGKIPNVLVVEANKLFAHGTGIIKQEALTEDGLKNMMEIMDIICEESFVEPTYQQIMDAGIELTDEQRLFVYSYVQTGTRALQSFRQ